MNTKCTTGQLTFQGLRKEIVITNDADVATSDGGLILLQQIEAKHNIIGRLTECFHDMRSPYLIQHSLYQLLGQRIYGLCQGYEDLNDHDIWRKDPLLGLVCGKKDGTFLSGKSTLNRLELGKEVNEDYGIRYSKITWDNEKIEDLFIDLFLESYIQKPKEIVLDFDATDDPLHGNQEDRFFHGYYDSYCYLPLYVFCGSYLLTARLRPSNIDASKGTVEVLQKIVPKIRERFPTTQIIVRADSGFCREKIMSWCDHNRVQYLFGLPKNNRLKRAIGKEMIKAKRLYEQYGEPQRIFKELTYRTKSSWSRKRRVVAKAEHLRKGANPRFIVTNIPILQIPGRALYEKMYCARGDMENRIKEQQLYLFADRTSTGWMTSNQLRLWFSSFAYTFFVLLRESYLAGTDMTRAQACTLRLKLLKVSASVKVTVRRIYIRLPDAYPYWSSWMDFCKAA